MLLYYLNYYIFNVINITLNIKTCNYTDLHHHFIFFYFLQQKHQKYLRGPSNIVFDNEAPQSQKDQEFSVVTQGSFFSF